MNECGKSEPRPGLFQSFGKLHIWLRAHTHMKVKAAPSHGSRGIPVLKHTLLCSFHQQHCLMLIKTGQGLRILSTLGEDWVQQPKQSKNVLLVPVGEEVFSPRLKTSSDSAAQTVRGSLINHQGAGALIHALLIYWKMIGQTMLEAWREHWGAWGSHGYLFWLLSLKRTRLSEIACAASCLPVYQMQDDVTAGGWKIATRLQVHSPCKATSCDEESCSLKVLHPAVTLGWQHHCCLSQ